MLNNFAMGTHILQPYPYGVTLGGEFLSYCYWKHARGRSVLIEALTARGLQRPLEKDLMPVWNDLAKEGLRPLEETPMYNAPPQPFESRGPLITWVGYSLWGRQNPDMTLSEAPEKLDLDEYGRPDLPVDHSAAATKSSSLSSLGWSSMGDQNVGT